MSKRSLLFIPLLLTVAMLICSLFALISINSALNASDVSGEAHDSAEGAFAAAFTGIGLAIAMVICSIVTAYLVISLLVKILACVTESIGGTVISLLLDIIACAMLFSSLYPNLNEIISAPADNIVLLASAGAVALSALFNIISFFARAKRI